MNDAFIFIAFGLVCFCVGLYVGFWGGNRAFKESHRINMREAAFLRDERQRLIRGWEAKDKTIAYLRSRARGFVMLTQSEYRKLVGLDKTGL